MAVHHSVKETSHHKDDHYSSDHLHNIFDWLLMSELHELLAEKMFISSVFKFVIKFNIG